MRDIDDTPKPSGELALQTIAMPADTNPSGDIFGGWLMSQMDLAGSITASRRAGGRVATVAVQFEYGFKCGLPACTIMNQPKSPKANLCLLL
jgi:acyl-CoA hydrolase